MSSLSKRAAPRGPGARPSPYGFPGRLLWRARPGRMEEMTVPLDTVNDMRSMDAPGRSRSEIARVLHVSRNTVAKYADMEAPAGGRGGQVVPVELIPRESPRTHLSYTSDFLLDPDWVRYFVRGPSFLELPMGNKVFGLVVDFIVQVGIFLKDIVDPRWTVGINRGNEAF